MVRTAVLGLGGVDLGLAAYVIKLYLDANRVARRDNEATRGALPYHVYIIASSHSLLIGGAMIAVVIRWGQPLTVVHPFVAVALTLTLVGLTDMLRYQQLRVRTALPSSDGGR
jgi:hypothetical protein